MKYEFSIALKYLLPRIKQISVSIISLLSILVISLVVWLILIFLSVTDGLEKAWVDRLVSLNAPLRITPTPAYYQSYYYQIDSISQASDFRFKNIEEKKDAEAADPYDPELDQELPFPWPVADRQADGSLKDLVKLAFESVQSLNHIPGMKAFDYEIALSQLKFQTKPPSSVGNASGGIKNAATENTLSYVSYVVSFPEKNPKLAKILQEPTPEDLTHFLEKIFQTSDNELSSRLRNFFNYVTISSLKTGPHGWIIPPSILPTAGKLKVCTLTVGSRINQVIIPKRADEQDRLYKELIDEGFQASKATLKFEGSHYTLEVNSKAVELSPNVPLILESGMLIEAKLAPQTIKNAKDISGLRFSIREKIQGILIQGEVPYPNFEIGKANVSNQFSTAPEEPPHWIYQVDHFGVLPNDAKLGYGVLLAKNFKTNGILLGDQGYLTYVSASAGSMQEQQLPIYVAGFYDPGIIPMGGKMMMASPEVTSLIRSSLSSYDQSMTNGIQVWFDQTERASEVKEALKKAFVEKGIAPYWQLESYHDYDFSKDLLNQLRSDKNLFTLIAMIIILVACSNIISMLILLVNDKKREVGILQSMGASSRSIALIFGTCGVAMGLISSLIGTVAAYFTLSNLQSLVDFISSLQGYDAFNTVFYGGALPNEMSSGALTMVWISTTFISLLAGLVPAIKASLLKPTSILRAE